MEFHPLSLPGLLLIEPTLHKDARGFFFESYQQERYQKHLKAKRPFCQDNHSLSSKGTIRGLHFQVAPWQSKLVRVIEGEIFDVAVDLRRSSPTFGQWEGVYLDACAHKQLYIPAGFAHGFCVTSDRAQIHYKVDVPYAKEKEFSLRWDDPQLQITWPTLPHYTLSQRDRGTNSLQSLLQEESALFLKEEFIG